MGVNGLWPFLEPTARPVRLEFLEGKILAVDSSIWLHQFLKAMRDKDGNVLKGAHVIGFFRRICKLLFFGVKPIFVYDGATPEIKKVALTRRAKRKVDSNVELKRAAQNILETRMKLALIGAQKPKDLKSTSIVSTDSQSTASSMKEHGDSKETENNKSVVKKRTQDEYEISNDSIFISDDPRLANDADLGMFVSDYIQTMGHQSSIDFESQHFKSLPIQLQHELILDEKLKSRQTSWEKLQRMVDSTSNAIDFSQMQIKNLVYRNKMTEKLANFTQNANLVSNPMKQTKKFKKIESKRIASQRNRQYLLMTNDETFGGWSMAAPTSKPTVNSSLALESTNKLMETDPIIPQDSDSEADSEEFVEVLNHVSSTMSVKDSVDDINDFSLLNIDEFLLNWKQLSPRDLQKERPDLVYRMEIAAKTWDLPRIEAEIDLEQSRANICKNVGYFISFLSSLKAFRGGISLECSFPSTINKNFETLGNSTESQLSSLDFPVAHSSIVPSSIIQSHTIHSHVSHQPESQPLTSESLELESQALQPPDSQPSLIKKPSMSPQSTQNDVGLYFSSDDDNESQDSKRHLSLENDAFNESATTFIPVSTCAEHVEIKMESDSLRNLSVNDLHEPQERPKEFLYHPIESHTHNQEPVSLETFQSLKIPIKTQIQDDESSLGNLTTKNNTTNYHSQLSAPKHQEIECINVSSDDEHPKIESQDTENFDIQEDEAMQGEIQEFHRFVSNLSNNLLDKPDAEDTFIDISKAGVNLSEISNAGEDTPIDLLELGNITVEQLQHDLSTYSEQRNRAQRNVSSITSEMISETQELLRAFGIPYIFAPAEAEAQCAFLQSSGLVHGIVTDDSDVFLFGGSNVYRHMFNQSKYVQLFVTQDIEEQTVFDREKLIRLAYLLGSDYTEGIHGIGLVKAVGILENFPGENGLKEFASWVRHLQSLPSIKLANDTGFRKKFSKYASNLSIPEIFPDDRVRNAYLNPNLDDSMLKPTWGHPDLDSIRSFLSMKVSWSQEKVDQVLIPVLKQMATRKKDGIQTNLFNWFVKK